MKKVCLVGLSILLIGCAATSNGFNTGEVEIKPIVPESLTAKRAQSQQVFLQLGIIPGAIYGSPFQEPYWYIDLGKNASPHFDIADLEEKIAPYSEKLNTEPPYDTYNSFAIEPADTQLVRLSTFGVDNVENDFFNAGLQNRDQQFLLLVYFDRPCRVEGEVDFGEEGVYQHNFEIPRAGLYTLILEEREDSESAVTAIMPVEPIYALLGSCLSEEECT